MISILIADDHAMFRDGLRRILEAEPGLKVLAEVSDVGEMIQRAREHRPDVVLLDLEMPGGGGLEGLEDLKKWDPSVRVLVLTAHPEDQYAVRCLKSGADGYLTKDETSETLIEAISKLYRGGKYVSLRMAEKLVLQLSGETEAAPHETLSGRELQVLCLLGSGRTVSDIARKLCLSAKTVSTYRSRILEKMHLSSTEGIIRYALTEGLVT